MENWKFEMPPEISESEIMAVPVEVPLEISESEIMAVH